MLVPGSIGMSITSTRLRCVRWLISASTPIGTVRSPYRAALRSVNRLAPLMPPAARAEISNNSTANASASRVPIFIF